MLIEVYHAKTTQSFYLCFCLACTLAYYKFMEKSVILDSVKLSISGKEFYIEAEYFENSLNFIKST